MEKVEKSATSQTLIEESRVLSFCNSNGNGGSDSVLVKCSSLVSDEAPQIKELSLANGNNVVKEDALVVSENDNNANGELDKDGVVGFKEGELLEKIEALEDGISLVVDIHGSPNNHAHNSDVEVVDVKENCDKDSTSRIGTEVLGDGVQKQMCEENCSRNSENEKSPGAEIEKFPIQNSIIKHEEQIKSEEEDEEELDDQDYKFSVGEFVWAKTLNRPWWPGQVYDPSDASKDIAMYYRKDRVLVAFFGDEASAWCYPSLVKPFQRNFCRMSMNGNSTSFHSAMEEALCRIGKYMESEWACSCVWPKTHTQFARPLASNSGIKEGVVVPQGRIAGLSVTEFEPAKFISRLRGIAEVVSEINLLERTAFQSQLLAFNRVNGWCDLRVYLDLQESSACCGNVGDTTTNDYDCKGLTGESVVKTFQADCPSLTVSNGIGRSSEKMSQKRRRSRNVYSPMESRKRKKHKNIEVVIKAEDGSSNGMPASSPKELEKADPSGSPSSFSDSKDTTLHNDEVSTVEGNGNGFSPRDRKKSKYLSPPYTMMSLECKSLNLLKDSVPTSPKVQRASHGEEYIASFGEPVRHSDVIISKNQSDGKNQRNVIGKVDVSEILFEFHSAALDPMHLKKSRKNDCVKSFFLNLRSYRHISDQATNESCAVGREAEEDAIFHGPQRTSVDTPLGLPGEHVHKTEYLKSAGGAKRKGRHWKEDARSQIPQGNSDVPLGSSGEDIQNKLFDVKIGLPVDHPHKTDQPQSEGGAQKRGRKRKKDATSESCQIKSEQASCTTNKGTKAAIGESSSATLLLNFAPGVPLPTKEDVITQFRRFGDLNELETDVMKDSSCARIVYTSKSNAEEAYNSSQKVSPFGAAVVSYELQYSTADSKASTANSQQRIPTLLGGNVVIPLSAVPPISAGGARSQIPQGNSDVPLGSSGEDIQNKLFDVKIGLPVDHPHKTDQPQSEGGAQKRGRKRKKDATSESCQIKSEQASCTTNKGTKAAIGESSSATLLLNFAPGVPLPTKEDVITQFRRFGDLNELETDVMKDSSCARIVYTSKSNAEEAYNSSQKVSPFGAAVVSYELQYSTADSKASTANSQQRIPTLLGGNVVIPLSAVPPISAGGARSQIPQGNSDVPLGSSGEDIQNKLFDVKIGLPVDHPHKTDQPQSEGGAQKRGRKRKKDATSESCQIKSEQASCTTNKGTKAAIGESSSATLLLNFAPGVPLPTKEDVITQFRRFGDLNELETDVMKYSSCARIVYTSKSNAEEAYNSSQKVSPFGAAVVSYELQYSTADSKASTANSQQRIPTLLGGNVVIPLSAVPPISEAPPLEVVRRNLESMTSMLEKAGGLSPEVKANLENEIKRLLNKVGTMV